MSEAKVAKRVLSPGHYLLKQLQSARNTASGKSLARVRRKS